MIALHVRDGRLAIRFEKLSEQQRAALVSDREVAVSAGAGAGKTSTLAARYVSLLAGLVDAGPPPDIASVLVLTFTEKAAQEMRERCYATTAAVARRLALDGARLVAEGLPESACLRLRARWEALRDRFSSAAISTFHGFCARVLREFPAETGTPPGFTILEEDDARELLQRTAAEVVDARIARGDARLGILLDTFRGRAGLVAVVAELLADRGDVEPTLRAHAEGRRGIGRVLDGAPLPPSEALRFVNEAWTPLADRLLALTAGVSTPMLHGVALLRAGLPGPPDDPLLVYERYGEALEVFRSSGGALRKLSDHRATGSKAAWGAAARHAAARPELAALQGALDAWAPRIAHLGQLPNRHDRTLVEVLAALGEVLGDASKEHAARLRAAGGVDFTELMLRVRDAFAQDGAVATELRRRHRYLMVDEFQDTDALQWSIVSALARAPGAPDDRLFFVGDVKQAIYGFRGGDVQVFDAARRTVAHGVELTTNYRSRPELITFFNRLFADVLGPDVPDRPAWEAPFSALEAGRVGSGGTVRLATYPGTGTDAEREAAWLGDLLRDEVLAEGGPYAGLRIHDLAEHPSPPVAVLFRRRTKLSAYEDALRARGIPYVVVGGVGFWSRPEVIDVANVLHALVRRDRLSLVAALRSPLFGLTDQDLWDLADADLLSRFGEVRLVEPFEGIDRIRAAQADWRALLDLKDRVSAAELLQAILVRTRQAWASAYATPGGRGEANLERLLALADRHEQRGVSLDALVARLQGRIDADASDAEAAVPNTTARVALLTVHASKGLEYPVVVVPDLAGGGAPPPRGVVTRRVGDRWDVACPVPDRHGPVARNVAPGLLGQLKAFGEKVEAAESRRLFYVACTRARDHLVLLGARSDEAPAMDDAVRWSDLLHAHDRPADDPPWLLRDAVPESTTADPAPAAPASLPLPPADLAERLAAMRSAPLVRVSPSSLAAFAEDPDAWYRRNVLRIPETRAITLDPRDEATLVASARGKVLHGLLEDNLLDDEDVARARWASAAYAEGVPVERVERSWPSLREQLDALRASEDVAAVLAANGYAELPVSLSVGPVTLDGRIDRLCRDPLDGAWMVVDYKSVRATEDPDAIVAAHRLQLLAYSVAASRVLAHHGQATVRRAAVLLTRTGRLHRLPDWTDADFAELEARLDAVAEKVGAEARGTGER